MNHDWYPAEHGLWQCGTCLMTAQQSTDVPDEPPALGYNGKGCNGPIVASFDCEHPDHDTFLGTLERLAQEWRLSEMRTDDCANDLLRMVAIQRQREADRG